VVLVPAVAAVAATGVVVVAPDASGAVVEETAVGAGATTALDAPTAELAVTDAAPVLL
jgi:hypothetical protein